MKVIFSGDRNWKDYDLVLDVLKRIIRKYVNVEVVQGECDGLDKMAKKAAIECNVIHHDYPADWKQFGRKAGPIRNRQMIKCENSEMCVAFHDNIEASKGTKDMINAAKQAGINTVLVTHGGIKNV